MSSDKSINQDFLLVAQKCGNCINPGDKDWPFFSKNTYPTEFNPILHVCVYNENCLKTLLETAHEHNIHLHPTSRGLNWGYGSRQPIGKPAVTVELKQLDKITHFNSDVGLVTIQSGVSFEQLDEFLKNEGDEFFVSVPGSSPTSSVVGNTLQRGIGLGPTSQRWKHVTGMKILLASGKILDLGCKDEQSGSVYSMETPGPNLHGLFFQSGFGIVLELTLEVSRHQKFERIFSVNSTSLYPLLSFYEALIKDIDIQTNTIITGALRLSNHGDRKSAKSANWCMRFASYFPTSDLDIAFSDYCNQIAFSLELSLQSDIIDRSEIRNGDFNNFHLLNGRFAGIPNKLGHYSLYSKTMSYDEFVKTEPDPNVDMKGLVWIDPIVLNTPNSVSALVEEISKIFVDHDWEPDIGMNLLDRYRCCVTIALRWDRRNHASEVIAMSIADSIHSCLNFHGIRPSRETHLAPNAHPSERGAIIKGIKNLLDPNDQFDM